MRSPWFAAAAASLSLFASGAAWAEAKPIGAFTAAKTCAALQSIRSGDNPGGVRLKVGDTYRVIEQNRPDGPSHYRLIIDGAKPAERWVEIGCGSFAAGAAAPAPAAAGTTMTPAPTPAAPAKPAAGAGTGAGMGPMLLALSWQPAFCESNDNGKPECQGLNDKSYTADHFSLHGLWPQGDRPGGTVCQGSPSKEKACDCGPSTRQLDLSPETKANLLKVMPGALNGFAAYEWSKHGTCYGAASQDAYFQQAVRLVDQLNAAAPQALFAANLGKELTADKIQAAFDQAFGPGAGLRVTIGCFNDKNSGRRLIKDIYVNIAGPITAESKLGDLIKAAQPARDNCAKGIVDPVGLQ